MAKPKMGGRTKGTPNKDVGPLREKAKELGIDPFEVLLYFASGNWQSLGYTSPTETKYTSSGEPYESIIITPDHRIRAASEACQYINAKRKAIEHEVKADAIVDIVYQAEWSSPIDNTTDKTNS